MGPYVMKVGPRRLALGSPSSFVPWDVAGWKMDPDFSSMYFLLKIGERSMLAYHSIPQGKW